MREHELSTDWQVERLTKLVESLSLEADELEFEVESDRSALAQEEEFIQEVGKAMGREDGAVKEQLRQLDYLRDKITRREQAVSYLRSASDYVKAVVGSDKE